MARTILAIAQEAAERDTIAPAPTTLFGTNDRIAKILRHAAKDTLREYMRGSRWEGLSEFHSTWVFSLLPNRFAYPMPPDFLRIIPNTEQRNGWVLGLVGPATPQSWARWVFGGQAVAAPMGWRIRNGALFIEPTPTSAELVAIEYISRYPVVSAIQSGDYDLTSYPLMTNAPVVARDGWLNITDPSVIVDYEDTDRIWDTGDEGWDASSWPDSPEEILRRLNPLSAVAPLPQVRRAEFTADDDLCAFDDDFILSLGMSWRLQRALGEPYAEIAAEYESEMENKLVEDAGGARSFRVGDDRPGDEVVPLGGGRWLVS